MRQGCIHAELLELRKETRSARSFRITMHSNTYLFFIEEGSRAWRYNVPLHRAWMIIVPETPVKHGRLT
jgi:hypothetical protein